MEAPAAAVDGGEATAGAGIGGRLAQNLVYFARALRTAGLPIGPGAVAEAIDAVQTAGIGTRDDVYWTLHAIFVKKHDHSLIFDQAFRLFFRKRAYLEKMLHQLSAEAPAREKPTGEAVRRRVADAFKTQSAAQPRPKTELEIDSRFTVSDRELLQKKDFAEMSAAEIAEAMRLVRSLALPLDMMPTRRLVRDPRGRAIDPRASFRRTLRTGGGLIALEHRGPDERHPPIVAICDISGSMATYTRVLLHFLHALGEARGRVHTFLFGTRLTNVTRALKHRDPDEALRRCSAGVLDWSGGTRIAESLRVFNRVWSRRVLGQGAIVLLFTDGLEREIDGTLAAETARLQRSCRKLIWLNPLLRFDGFEARAQGIRAMIGHVDEFRSIHNLDSMADLCRALDGSRRGNGDPRRFITAEAPQAAASGAAAPLSPSQEAATGSRSRR